MRAIGRRAFEIASSLGLACVLLLCLGLLTWLGTLAQVDAGLYEVQRKYFESYFLVHDAGGFPIPLPGANLVLSLLAVNLILGGFVRIRKSRQTVDILVAHAGILLLLVGGFVEHRAADDGRVTLYEGQSASWFESDIRWEIALSERLSDGSMREHVVPLEQVAHATRAKPVVIEIAGLPLVVEVLESEVNARILGARDDSGPRIEAQPLDPEVARNIPAARIAVAALDGAERNEAILSAMRSTPFATTIRGQRIQVDLRRERHALPFTLTLSDFRKVDHPRSSMPRSFESDVVVDGARKVTISMNEPLRSAGYVVYQASWGPQGAAGGARLFSTFAVVRNPADRWPIVACAVIAIGLVVHFGRKLARATRAQGAA